MSQTENINPLVAFRAEAAAMEAQFRMALPKQIPADRFGRVVQTAVQNNPALMKVERRSLWNAVMKAAHDGLLPDGREAALVVYRDKRRGDIAQYMPMIAGLRKKVRNSGDLEDWSVQVVRMNDLFEHELGDHPFIRHAPNLDDPGAFRGVYSIATLKGGAKSYEIMNKAQVDAIRERSRAAASGPWVTDYEEMARKTVARRHAKVLPMSTDLDDLLRRDDDLDGEEADSGPEMAPAAALARPRPASIAARLDAVVRPPVPSSSGVPGDSEDPSAGVDDGDTIDQETGEIVPAEPRPATEQETARRLSRAEIDQVEQAWQDTRTAPAKLAAAVEARDRQFENAQLDEPRRDGTYAPQEAPETRTDWPPPAEPPKRRTLEPDDYIARAESIIEAAEDAEQVNRWWNSDQQRAFRDECGLTTAATRALRKKLSDKLTELAGRPERQP